MAEETVVRLRIEQIVEGDEVVARVVAQTEKLAGAEAKLAREARPAAASISKLGQQFDATTGQMQRQNAGMQTLLDKFRRGELSAKQLASAERLASEAARLHVDVLSKEGQQLSKLIDQQDRLQKELRETTAAERGAGEAGTGLAAVGAKISAAFAAIAVGAMIKRLGSDTLAAVRESEAALAQLEARVQSTGGTAGFTAKQLEAMAGRFSSSLGIDDEAIARAEARLLTFEDVTGGTFERIIALGADLSVAMGDDLTAAVTLIGKAAQEPEETLSQLSRSIGRFTDAEEQAIIKAAKMGDEAKAQAFLLDILERRVGGAAAAYRDTLGGALDQLGVEWENLLETIGDDPGSILRQFAEDGVDALVWLRENLFVFRAVWLGTLEDLNRATAFFARGLEDLARWSKFLGNFSGNKAADQLGKSADRLEQEVIRLAKLQEHILSAGAGTSGIFGTIPDDINPRKPGRASSSGELDREAEAMKKLVAAADQMASATKQEAQERKDLLAILQEEGRTREELADAYREAEIQAKAEAKVQEIRAAYLKAGRVLTDQNAAAIRAWVIESERAVDATAKWLAVTAKLPAVLEALPARGIVIPARISFENFGQAGSTAPSVDVEAVIKWLTIDEEVKAKNKEAQEEYEEAQRQSLEQLAEDFRASLASPRDELETTLRAINALAQAADDAGEPLLSAAEAERLRAEAVAAYTMQQLDQQMAAWGGFFSYLGSAFGGVVQQIASAIQSIQGGISTGQGMGQAMGGTAAAAAAGGAAGAIVAVVIEVYKYMKSEAAKRKAESYGYGAVVGKSAGQDWNIPMSDQGRRASLQIKETLEALAEVMGGAISSFADIEIKVRRDGKYFHAFVEDFFVGSFTDMQSAIEASILRALKDPGTTFAGVSELVQQGLQYALSDGAANVGTLEELQDFLSKLKDISDLSLGPLGAGLQASMRELNRLRDALNKLDQSSSAVAEAQRDLWEAQRRLVEETKAQALGIDYSAAEAIRSLGGLQESLRGVGETMRSGLESSINAVEAQLAALDKPASTLEGGAGGQGDHVTRLFSGTVGAIETERQRLEKALAEFKRQLGEVPEALTDAEIDLGVFTALEGYLRKSGKHGELIAKFEKMRLEREFERLRLELIAIGAWERWAETWQALYNEAQKAAGRPAGGGGGGRDLKGEREDLRRELGRILAESRGDLHLLFFDLGESIADLTKRWKEAKLPLADLTAGIAALTAAAQKQAKQRMDELAGVGSDFTRSLQEGLDFFREMRELGRGKTGVADWKVDVRERQFKERMQADFQARLAEFGGVANPMLEIAANAARLEQELTALAEATGMSAEEIAAARAAIAEGREFQREQAVSGIMDRVFGYLRNSEKHAAKVAEFDRKKVDIEFKLIEAQLKFLNAWDEETAKLVADAKEIAQNLSAGAQASDRFAARMEAYWQAQQDAADRWKRAMEAGAQAVQEWRSAVKEWSDSTHALLTDETTTNLTQAQQLAEAERRYEELLARAQGGDASAVRELIRARAEWIAEGRESEAGGAGFDRIWRRILETSGSFLETAQAQEDDIFQQAFREAMVAEAQNAEKITTAVYDAAQIVANKIDELLAGMPAYASGGVLNFPHMARVGEVPEAVVPLAGGGVPVSWVGGPPSSSSANMAPVVSLLAAMERRLARVEDHLGDINGSSKTTADTNKQMATGEGRLASEVKRLRGGNRQRG